MNVLVDTNLLLRLAQPAHPHHATAVRALEILKSAGNQLCVVPQIIYEYWSVCTRPVGENGLGMPIDRAVEEIDRMKRLFALYRDERSVFNFWERLVAAHEVRGRNSHDARLVAAMQRHGLSHLLTFNSADFVRFCVDCGASS